METTKLFHHHVTKLLFLCKHAWPDIQTTVAFLGQQVQCSDTDDYKKLAYVMRYLCGTMLIPLTLEADQSNNLYSDGAFAKYDDMQSHTGGALSLGWRVVMAHQCA